MQQVENIYYTWLDQFNQAIINMKPQSLLGTRWLMDNFLSRFDMELDAFDEPAYRVRINNYVTHVLLPHKVAVFSQGIELYGYILSRQPFIKKHLSLDDFALQLFVHDLSKYSSEELVGYAFYDFDLPKYDAEHLKKERTRLMDMNSEAATKSLAKAWEHHQRVNAHHPQYYYYSSGVGEMPQKFILEMLADWKGTGMTYGTPLEQWIRTEHGIKSYKFKRSTAGYVDHYLSLMGIDTSKLQINGV